jgi:Na+-translocating ferredoxin:NAD+ oxidoreductase subunit E
MPLMLIAKKCLRTEEIKMVGKKILQENPVLVSISGLCPAVAITTTVANSLVLGIGTIFVLLLTILVAYMLRKIIAEKFATGFHIIVAAGFTTVVQLVVDAYFPEVSSSLGIFIALIAVNCIVIENVGLARKRILSDALKNGLGLGLGFLLVLFLMGAIREIGGAGTFLGFSLLESGPATNSLLMLVPGGLLVLSALCAFTRWFHIRFGKARKGALHS